MKLICQWRKTRSERSAVTSGRGGRSHTQPCSIDSGTRPSVRGQAGFVLSWTRIPTLEHGSGVLCHQEKGCVKDLWGLPAPLLSTCWLVIRACPCLPGARSTVQNVPRLPGPGHGGLWEHEPKSLSPAFLSCFALLTLFIVIYNSCYKCFSESLKQFALLCCLNIILGFKCSWF